MDAVYESHVTKKITDILKDIYHPLHKFYSVAKSGCRYLSERALKNRYWNIFLPASIRMLNARSGRGNERGGREEGGRKGGIGDVYMNCAAYVITTTTTIINIVM